MFYLSIEKIRGYNSCPDGPEILKWFECRYGEKELIPLSTLFLNFGKIHTVFCLRAVDGGSEFAIKYAINCG